MTEEDQELRERFARLRAEQAERAPEFARVWAGAHTHVRASRRAGLRLALTAVGSAVAVAGLLLLRPSPPPRPSPAGAGAPWLGDWRAPTDFLLQTPGRELLSTLPSLGRGPSLPLPSPTPERSTSS